MVGVPFDIFISFELLWAVETVDFRFELLFRPGRKFGLFCYQGNPVKILPGSPSIQSG
jgi:hypothetical protein